MKKLLLLGLLIAHLVPLAHAQRKLAPGQVARLMTLGVEGNDPRVVYESQESIIEAPNWSPDGKWLVFNGSGALWRVPADGSAPPEKIPTGQARGVNNDHILSPDGLTIYFSAGGQIYAVPFAGRENLGVSSRVQAVCDWYGLTDFLQMDAQAPPGLKAMKHHPATSPESLLVGGTIQEHPDRVRHANPITYLTKDSPPRRWKEKETIRLRRRHGWTLIRTARAVGEWTIFRKPLPIDVH